MTTRLRAAAALGVVLLATTACGSAGDSGSGADAQATASPTTTQTAAQTATGGGTEAASAAHNDQDVAFATGMIPHHGQAIQMADMALASAQSGEVKTLAQQIKDAQDPEIQTMSSWLQEWGQPVPAPTAAAEGEGHMGHGSMDGMMSQQQMTQLHQAQGDAFDRMWLQMMIEHHQGAVTMSQQEIDSGENPAAVALAEQIISGQQAEIQHMQQLLK